VQRTALASREATDYGRSEDYPRSPEDAVNRPKLPQTSKKPGQPARAFLDSSPIDQAAGL
jgi:hypothetical protein